MYPITRKESAVNHELLYSRKESPLLRAFRRQFVVLFTQIPELSYVGGTSSSKLGSDS